MLERHLRTHTGWRGLIFQLASRPAFPIFDGNSTLISRLPGDQEQTKGRQHEPDVAELHNAVQAVSTMRCLPFLSEWTNR
jgi:hypothetical protein